MQLFVNEEWWKKRPICKRVRFINNCKLTTTTSKTKKKPKIKWFAHFWAHCSAHICNLLHKSYSLFFQPILIETKTATNYFVWDLSYRGSWDHIIVWKENAINIDTWYEQFIRVEIFWNDIEKHANIRKKREIEIERGGGLSYFMLSSTIALHIWVNAIGHVGATKTDKIRLLCYQT